jgi:hypothetical protein
MSKNRPELVKIKSDSIFLGKGEFCFKHGTHMKRFVHPKGWKPKPNQDFYLSYWDICKKCHKIIVYKDAKVYTNTDQVIWADKWED